tara:strand:- start:256 stop:1128 length:873 start_codon:yes stop_codon:yes gene_type:complete
MKKYITLLLSICFLSNVSTSQLYDTNLVHHKTESYQGETFDVVYLSRKDKRVNSKYFAYEMNGKSVSARFDEFSKSNNVILYTTGAYEDGYGPYKKAVGLSIDNGKIVNRTIANMDGLLIIYPTGGVVVSNLDEGNLVISEKKYDIRGRGSDFVLFKIWAEKMKASVFQTHLLAWNGQLQFKLSKEAYSNTSPGKQLRERRFLVLGMNKNGDVIHCLINYPNNNNLYDASETVLSFLQNEKEIKVISMTNIDTGAGDILGLFESNGEKSEKVTGPVSIENAGNLLIYYYK